MSTMICSYTNLMPAIFYLLEVMMMSAPLIAQNLLEGAYSRYRFVNTGNLLMSGIEGLGKTRPDIEKITTKTRPVGSK